jgi:hypothetical protein
MGLGLTELFYRFLQMMLQHFFDLFDYESIWMQLGKTDKLTLGHFCCKTYSISRYIP